MLFCTCVFTCVCGRRGLLLFPTFFHAGVPAQQLPTDSHLVWGSSRSAGCPSRRGRSQPWGRSSTLNRMGSGSVELRGTRRVLTARWRPGDQIPTFIWAWGGRAKGGRTWWDPTNGTDGREMQPSGCCGRAARGYARTGRPAGSLFHPCYFRVTEHCWVEKRQPLIPPHPCSRCPRPCDGTPASVLQPSHTAATRRGPRPNNKDIGI